MTNKRKMSSRSLELGGKIKIRKISLFKVMIILVDKRFKGR